MTIVETIKEVLKKKVQPLTIEEIYNEIIYRKLYEFKATEPKSVVRSQIRRHCIGLDFPSANPVKYFKITGGECYSLASEDEINKGDVTTVTGKDALPEELIEASHKEHMTGLKQQLLEKILLNHPKFFEKLVIELLLSMGYGDKTLGSSAGIHTGKRGDKGIDGVIKSDKLGLELIYIQAKRNKPSKSITPTQVRDFLGSMGIASKGVFITTSCFSKDAADALKRDPSKKVALINGDELCELMILHGIGVSEVKKYKIMKIDADYFAIDN